MERMLGMTEVSERTGIPLDTLYTMKNRGKLPPPDQVVGGGRTRLWTEATIDAWNEARPRRGGRSE